MQREASVSVPVSLGRNRRVAELSDIMRQSHQISAVDLVPLRNRDHMARPYPGSDFDFLAVNVPVTYQQGVIPDGEEPPWGLLRIVASARQTYGLDAGILDAHRLKLGAEYIAEQLERIRPRLVGLNPTSLNVPEAQMVAEVCSQLGIPYVLGGVHATIDPAVARGDFPSANAVVRGSGDLVVGDLVSSILKGRELDLPGVYFQGREYASFSRYTQRFDPGAIPIVNQRELIEEPIYTHKITVNGKPAQILEATLFVTDGCPFDCTFCSNPVMVNRGGMENKPYGRPSMDRILMEVEHCVRDLGATAIHFLDDMAFVQERHIAEFHRGLQKRELMGAFIWRALTRASFIERFSDDTMRMMKESGAWKIELGVESGSADILKAIKKKVTREQVIAAVARLSRYGIQSKGFFIMGFPGETEADIQYTRSLIGILKDEGMTDVTVFQFKPYPGTEEFVRLATTRPEVISQLQYLRRDVGPREEGHDTWLPDSLRIAEVPSGRVREQVIAAMEEFYGRGITGTQI